MQKIIYKYYGLDYKNINEPKPRTAWINNYLFRFTQPNKLNDPFEVRPKLLFNTYSKEDYERAYEQAIQSDFFQDPKDITKDKLERFFLNSMLKRLGDIKPWPQYIEKYDKTFNSFEEFDKYEAEVLLKNFLTNVNISRGVFCLTRTKRNLLMWSHYASEHKGIAIGFDTSHSFFQDNLHEVLYSRERVSISAVKGWIRINGYKQEEFSNNDIDTFLRKPTCWEYEKEIRMVKYLTEADKLHQEIYLFKIPPIAIKELIFGAHISANDRDLILNELSKNENLKHIKIYQASLHDKKYALEFKLL